MKDRISKKEMNRLMGKKNKPKSDFNSLKDKNGYTRKKIDIRNFNKEFYVTD